MNASHVNMVETTGTIVELGIFFHCRLVLQTEKLFYERRMRLEKEQKIHMALGIAKNVRPLFTSGQAYWQSELASRQLQQYQKIRDHVRYERTKIDSKNKIIGKSKF